MANYLKVTPERLNAVSGELEGENTAMKGHTDRMLSLVNELSGDIWSGDAATAYKAKFAGLQDDMNALYRMVEEHVKDLQEIAANYTEAETANQEAAGALSTDIIS
ncbi:MAG: WXG100 family type VII secretion target [Blautia sp.]|nr:WXG100 family type VII secretion target [Blautia sp.]